MAKRKKDNVVDTKKEEKKDEKVQLTSQGEQFEKALFVQRFLAFLLDIFLISIVASIISYPFLDIDSIQKLNESSAEVMENYATGKINQKEYFNESSTISYELARKQGVNTLIIIFLNILYFVVYQIKNNGQTLGKQILKIRVVDSSNCDLSMNQMIFRALIINSILLDMISFGVLIFANQSSYFYGVSFLAFIQFCILSVSTFMIMFGKDRRGLHDLVAHTDVVRCDVVKEMETCEN